MGLFSKLKSGEYDIRYRAKREAVKTVRYASSVGQNVINDVTSDTKQMFPFRIPQEPQHRKKHKRQTYNPYSLI